jgi:hypothetical protein
MDALPMPTDQMINGVGWGLTPAADTNALGHSCTQVDARNAPSQAMDSTGQLGWALQAGGHRSQGGLATSPCPLGCRRANADTRGNRQGLRTVLARAHQLLPGARWAHVSGQWSLSLALDRTQKYRKGIRSVAASRPIGLASVAKRSIGWF